MDDLELQIIYECIGLKGMSIREAAAHCGLSKSTVHENIHKKMKTTHPLWYEKVKKVLDENNTHM